jgi:hypothetical protein
MFGNDCSRGRFVTLCRHYSRSIGTDVRFILYLVGEYDGAKVAIV